MKIDYLVKYKEYINTISEWLYNQWGYHYPEKTREDYLNGVKKRMNKKTVPTTFIAIENKKPVGTASLIEHDMDNHQHLTPWLADVYVKPEVRNQGIGTNLLSSVLTEAKDRAVGCVDLFTREAKNLYFKIGWEKLKTARYHGDIVDIMFYDL